MTNKIPPQTIVENEDPALTKGEENIYPQNFQDVPPLTGSSNVNVTVNCTNQNITNTFNYPYGQQYEVQFKNGNKFDGNNGLTYNPTSQTLNSQNLNVSGISCLGTESCLRIDGGDPGYVLTKLNNTGSVVWCDPSGFIANSLCVGTVNTYNTYSNCLTGVQKLGFDTDSGFEVTDLGSGIAKIGMNSTFKCWEVNGSSGLIACGLDTVNFIAGSGVTITSDNTAIPKSLTISSTGGGGSPGGCNTQVQFNNSGSFAGDDGLTYCTVSKTLGLCNIAGPLNTDINIQTTSEDSTWYASYGDSPTNLREDYSSAAAYDSLGNLYFIGADGDNGIPYVVKYDKNGILVWQKEFTNTSGDYKTGDMIVIDSDDNIYCAFLVTASPQFYSLVKLDSNGNIIWQKDFDPSNDYIVDMAVDSLNNIILAIADTYYQIKVIKLDSTGVIIWQKYYQDIDSTDNQARSISTDSSNNIYVGVRLTGTHSLMLLKLDSMGDVLWSKKAIAGSTQQTTGLITVDSTGNIYVTGSQYSFSGDKTFLMKFDSLGNLVWQRNVAGNPNTYGVAVDNSNNVYLGMVDDNNTPTDTYGFLIIKFDSLGNTIWQRTLDGTDNEYQWYYNSYSQITTYGNYFAINGWTYTIDPNNSSSEAIVAQLSQDGSGLGTYGKFTYAEINLAIDSNTFTVDTATMTSTALSHTVSPGSLIINSATNSSTTYYMVGGINNWSFNKDGSIDTPYYKIPKSFGTCGQSLVASSDGTSATWCTIKPTIDKFNGSFYVRNYDQTNIVTSGNHNIGIGYSSLLNNTGSEQIGLGYSTLCNSSGLRNIAIGNLSLTCNTYGCDNISVGVLSLCSNTAGDKNIGIGCRVLALNSTGSCNIAIGHCAMFCGTNGCRNIGLGTTALHFANGVDNIAIGFAAGGSGSCNIALGNNAGPQLNVSSCNNIVIGNNAAQVNFSCGLCHNIIMGYGALAGYNSDNSCENIYIGGSAGQYNNGQKTYNIVMGYRAHDCSTGSYCNNVIIGTCSGWFTNGNGNIFIGNGATSYGNCILKMVTGTSDGNRQTRINASCNGLYVNADTTSSEGKHVWAGGVWAFGAEYIYQPSSPITLNLNIGSAFYIIEPTTDFVLKLDGNFDWPYSGIGASYKTTTVKIVIKQGSVPRIMSGIEIKTYGTQTFSWLNNTPPTGTANRVNLLTLELFNFNDSYILAKLESY